MDDFELGLEVGGNAQPQYGKGDIDALFAYWQERIGYPIASNKTENRRRLHNMLQSYNVAEMKQLVDAVAMSQTDQFAPRIGDFVQLFYKLNQLLAWIKRQGGGQETIEVD